MVCTRAVQFVVEALVDPYALSLPAHVPFHVAESFTLSLAKQVLNGKNGFGDQDDRTQCAFDLSPPSRLKARNPMLPNTAVPTCRRRSWQRTTPQTLITSHQ